MVENTKGCYKKDHKARNLRSELRDKTVYSGGAKAIHPQQMTLFSIHLDANKFESASVCRFKESLHHCHGVTDLFYAEVASGDPNQPPQNRTPQHILPTSSHDSPEHKGLNYSARSNNDTCPSVVWVIKSITQEHPMLLLRSSLLFLIVLDILALYLQPLLEVILY